MCGCAGASDSSEPESNIATDRVAPSLTEAPSVIEMSGRAFQRREDWSDEEFERILYEGRAQQDSTDPNILAAQLRAHTVTQGHYYIELEPNLELAQKILNDPLPGPTQEGAPREERTVIGSDTRTHWSLPNQAPAIFMGFNNSGGSGGKVASHAMYTAAHVVYETFLSPDGWYCANGTHAGSCSPWPAWRFGVEGTSGFTNWTTNGCYSETSPMRISRSPLVTTIGRRRVGTILRSIRRHAPTGTQDGSGR